MLSAFFMDSFTCSTPLGITARGTQHLPERLQREPVVLNASRLRAPDQVEHQFRGKWNTGSGACGTPIPGKWNTDSGQVERTLEVGNGMGNPVER